MRWCLVVIVVSLLTTGCSSPAEEQAAKPAPTSACAIYRGQSSSKYGECLAEEEEERAFWESERKASIYDRSECDSDPRGGC